MPETATPPNYTTQLALIQSHKLKVTAEQLANSQNQSGLFPTRKHTYSLPE